VLTVPGLASWCDGTSTLIARQSAARVALRVRDDAVPCPPGAAAWAMSAPLSVRLAAPLGKRKLVNAATGQPIARFSAPLLLRPDYQLREVDPQPTGPKAHPVAGVELHYARSHAAGDLWLTEYPDSPHVPPPWQPPAKEGPWARIRVRGVPGWASPAGIAWRQHGLIYSISAGPPTESGGPPLTTARLIAMANSAAL
jgi:hypothetical protein